MSRELSRRHAWRAIALAIAVSMAVQWVPYLDLLGWPLLLGSTLAHELGHGLAAMALGGSFESIKLFPDGSGVAAYRAAFSDSQIAVVAASGLLGPPAAAWALLLSGRSLRASHVGLGALALLLAAVALIWADNWLTKIFCATLGLLLGATAVRGGPQFSQVLCVFMAVQLGLASFTRADYLFMPSARTGQGTMLSDVGQIADAWWLPYWFWGGLIAVLSLVFLLGGCWQFLRALR